MTIKEFKSRFKEGVQIRQTWNHVQGTVNLVSTVTKVQTECVRLRRESDGAPVWLDFPKAREIYWTERGWIRLDAVGTKIAQYEWVEGTAR